VRAPSPIRAIRLRGRRLGSGRWLAWACGRGRVGMLGLSLTIRGRSIIRLHPLAVLHPLALAPAWEYRRPDGYRAK
jgi:hypothetical protein